MLHAIELAKEARAGQWPAVGADPAQHHVAAVQLLAQRLKRARVPGFSPP
jgi:hypothetical protein